MRKQISFLILLAIFEHVTAPPPRPRTPSHQIQRLMVIADANDEKIDTLARRRQNRPHISRRGIEMRFKTPCPRRLIPPKFRRLLSPYDRDVQGPGELVYIKGRCRLWWLQDADPGYWIVSGFDIFLFKYMDYKKVLSSNCREFRIRDFRILY